MTADDTDGTSPRVNRRRALAIGGAAALAIVSTRRLPGASGRSENTDRSTSDGDALQRVHDADITGDGVDVAVLDPTGFDPTHDAIAPNLAEIRQFGSQSAVVDRTTHGTAAAASVARLAPDSRLSVASFRDAAEFVEAVEWCVERETDVLLAPVAAHGSVASPRSAVYRGARRAVESGCVVVAPTGNAALGHWEGPPAALLGDGGGEARHLRIDPLPGTASVSGQLTTWLVADDAIHTDLTLALLRAVDGGDRRNLVAVSRSVSSRAGQRLTADLEQGRYTLVVRPATPDEPAIDPESAGRRIEVTTPTHAVSPAQSLGSIAVPASVPGVVGVGVTDAPTREAPDTDADAVAPYSGRGPTSEGNVGVDIVAPPRPWIASDTPGTSAAAARVAGVAALLRDVAPDLAPVPLARTLRASAADIGRPGPDVAAGYGRLDVLATVQRVRAR